MYWTLCVFPQSIYLLCLPNITNATRYPPLPTILCILPEYVDYCAITMHNNSLVKEFLVTYFSIKTLLNILGKSYIEREGKIFWDFLNKKGNIYFWLPMNENEIIYAEVLQKLIIFICSQIRTFSSPLGPRLKVNQCEIDVKSRWNQSEIKTKSRSWIYDEIKMKWRCNQGEIKFKSNLRSNQI